MASPLKELLTEAGVPETFSDRLDEDGWTIPLFACAATSLDTFDNALTELLGDLHDIITPIQKAAFRLAWQRCSNSQSSAPSSSSQAAAPAESAASWSESFAPKLTASVVADLKKQFKQNYPSEILVPENTPGIRLISLVHDMKAKNDYKWVPWKYRISQHRADELTSKTAYAGPQSWRPRQPIAQSCPWFPTWLQNGVGHTIQRCTR